MNDILKIANDSLKLVLSSTNETANNSVETTPKNVVLTIVILIVIATSFYFIVRTILLSIKESRKLSLQHEEKMQELNIIKEERKWLLDFCYDMAKKKESETKDFFEETTITETTKSSTNGKSSEKEETTIREVNTTIKENKEEKHKEETISLDQIRHECWLIIKQMNAIKDLTNP